MPPTRERANASEPARSERGDEAPSETAGRGVRGGEAPRATEDAELVRQGLAGSQEAFRELVTRYAPVAVSFIARLVQDRTLAEDLAQDAFLRAFRRLPTYDPNRRFLSWFLQVAHNVTVDHLRKKRRDVVPLEPLLDAGRVQAIVDRKGASPAVHAERAALASALEAALARIRPEHRSAIVLHYQEDLSHAEISDVLGVPVATVKTFLHRGRRELAVLLAEQGWGPGETLRPAAP